MRDVDVRGFARIEQRGDQLVRRLALAQDELTGLELAGQPPRRRFVDERAGITQEPFVLEPSRDRRRGVPRRDRERQLGLVVARRGRQVLPEILANDAAHERDRQRAGIVGRPRHDRVVDERPQRGEPDDEHEAAEREREQQELQDPRNAAPPTPAAASVPAPRIGLAEPRNRFGRVRVGFVSGRRAFATRAPARADAQGLVSVRWGLAGDAYCTAARASISSWRMIAAASRSTRARYASRWARVGGPPERPRFIGPRRCSARWLVSRSSRMVSGNPSASAICRGPRRCQLGLRPVLTGRLERQADDELGDLPAPPRARQALPRRRRASGAAGSCRTAAPPNRRHRRRPARSGAPRGRPPAGASRRRALARCR